MGQNLQRRVSTRASERAPWRASLVNCNSVDLFQTCNAVLDFLQTGLAEVGDTFLLRFGRDLHRVAALHHDSPDLLGARHHLVDADAALVPGGALRAAFRAEDRYAGVDVGARETFLEQRFGRDLDGLFAVAAEL